MLLFLTNQVIFFAGKYQDLYTSVQFDPVDMAEINNKIFNLISVDGFDGDCIVTCVTKADCRHACRLHGLVYCVIL